MGKSKEEFMRFRFLQDFRETGDYPPFDHEYNFQRKVKENWLTTEDFRNLKNADYFTITKALIEKKMDSEYHDELIKLIDKAEPKYIKGEAGLEYIKLVVKSGQENMKRVYLKYDNVDYFIESKLRKGLELLK